MCRLSRRRPRLLPRRFWGPLGLKKGNRISLFVVCNPQQDAVFLLLYYFLLVSFCRLLIHSIVVTATFLLLLFHHLICISVYCVFVCIYNMYLNVSLTCVCAYLLCTFYLYLLCVFSNLCILHVLFKHTS